MAESRLGGGRVAGPLGGIGRVAVAEVAEVYRGDTHLSCCRLEDTGVDTRQERLLEAVLLASGFEDLEGPGGEAEYTLLAVFRGLGRDTQDRWDVGASGCRFNPGPHHFLDLLGTEARPKDEFRLRARSPCARVGPQGIKPEKENSYGEQLAPLGGLWRVRANFVPSGWGTANPPTFVSDYQPAAQRLDLLPDGLAPGTFFSSITDIFFDDRLCNCRRVSVCAKETTDMFPGVLNGRLLSLSITRVHGSLDIEPSEKGEVGAFPPPRATSFGDAVLADLPRGILSRAAISLAS